MELVPESKEDGTRTVIWRMTGPLAIPFKQLIRADMDERLECIFDILDLMFLKAMHGRCKR